LSVIGHQLSLIVFETKNLLVGLS